MWTIFFPRSFSVPPSCWAMYRITAELAAVDAAVALVDEREVVDDPVGDRNPARGEGSGPVDQERDEHLLGLGMYRRRHRPGDERRRQRTDPQRLQAHGNPPRT